MSFLCFTPKRAGSSPKKGDLPSKPMTSSLRQNADIVTLIRKTTNDGRLAIVCWTASFSHLHTETCRQFEKLASRYSAALQFAIASVDDLPEKAQEYAVCSLPSFYVFQQSGVVAKFEGLSSLTALEHLLICRTDSRTSEGSCLTSGGAVEAERAGEECRSCANPAHMHEVAVRGHKRSKSSISSSESTASTQTEDVHLSIDGSLADSSRPQSYLPRFVKTRRISASMMNWHPATDFGIYRFQ